MLLDLRQIRILWCSSPVLETGWRHFLYNIGSLSFYLKQQQHFRKRKRILVGVFPLPRCGIRTYFNFFNFSTSYQNSNKVLLFLICGCWVFMRMLEYIIFSCYPHLSVGHRSWWIFVKYIVCLVIGERFLSQEQELKSTGISLQMEKILLWGQHLQMVHDCWYSYEKMPEPLWKICECSVLWA